MPLLSATAAGERKKRSFDPFSTGQADPEEFDPFAAGQAEPDSSAIGNAFVNMAQSAVRGTGEAVSGTWRLADQLLGDLPQRATFALARRLGIIDDKQAELGQKLTDMGVRFTPDAQKVKQAAANADVSGKEIQSLADLYHPDPARQGEFLQQAASAIGGLAPVLASPGTALPVLAGQFGESTREQAMAEGDTPDVADAKFNLGASGGAALGLVGVNPRMASPIVNAGIRTVAGGGINAGQDAVLQKVIKPDQAIDWSRVRFNAIFGSMFGAAHGVSDLTRGRIMARVENLAPAEQTSAKIQEIVDQEVPAPKGKEFDPFASGRAEPIASTDANVTGVQASGPKSDSGTPSERMNSADAGGFIAASRTSSPGDLTQPLDGPSQASANTLPDSSTLRTTEPPALAGQSTTLIGEVDAATGKKVLQPTNDVKWLFASSHAEMPRFTQLLDSLANTIPGVQVTGARVKGDTPRLRQKMGSRPASTISDFLGGRLAIDDFKQGDAIRNALGDRVVEDENFMDTPRNGYRARHLQVKVDNGMTAELQLVPRDIAQVQDLAHRSYEVLRAPSVTVEQRRLAQALTTSIFDQAWSDFQTRNGRLVGRAQSLPELPKTEFPITEFPVDKIEVNKDVPQFKADANQKTGVVEGNKLGGKYERLGTGPIIVWEKVDGTHEVVTGRHRLDLARRSGEATIPTQIVREVDGWTQPRVVALDAQSNIRSGQGTVKDFALYFRTDQNLTAEDAAAKGLTQRAKGAAGWALGRAATQPLWDLYANNQLPEAKAVAIARGAPAHEAAQASAIRAAAGKTPAELELYARNLSRSVAQASSAEQMGFAGVAQDFADFEREAAAVAKVQAERMAANRQLIEAAAGAAKRPEAARKMGLPVNDPAQLQARVDQLRAENDRLANPDESTYQELRQAAGLPRQEVSPAGEAPAGPPVEDPAQTGMFARRKAVPLTRDQTDIFDSGPLAGGETGGDQTFNLASDSGQDFGGFMDRRAEIQAAQAAQEQAQGSLFRRERKAADRTAADAFAAADPAERAAIATQLDQDRARWRTEADKIAPGLMSRFRLRFGDPESLVRDGRVKPEELTGWEQAFYDGHERMLYLFDRALQRNSTALTRLNLLHEMGHAHWDTLARDRQLELAELWRKETGDRQGPLYDGRKQLRAGVAQGIEGDIREWYAERVAWENHRWASARAAGDDARIFGPVARAAQSLRILLQDLKAWLAQMRGQSVNVDFRQFLDQGQRFEAAGAPRLELGDQVTGFVRRAPGSQHTPQSAADRMRDAIADFGGFLRRELTSRGHLPEAVFQARVERDGRITAIEKQMKFALADLDAGVRAVYGGWGGVSAADQAKLNDVLGGHVPVQSVDPRLQKPIEEMRRHVDVLSRRLVREGVVGGDLAARVAGNLGFYLNRSYRKFDDPAWVQKVEPQVLNRASSFIRAELREDVLDRAADAQAQAQGITTRRAQAWKDIRDTLAHDITIQPNEADVQGLVEYLLTKDLAEPADLFTKGAADRKDLTVLTRRKEIAPEIRALLGEYQDPRVNYARSVAKTAQLLEAHRFLGEARVAGLGKFLFERPQPGAAVRLSAEGSKAMAPLDGLYTTPEIADAFHRTFDERKPQNPAWRAYLGLNGWVKMAKTVFNPVTQVRNFMANFGFLVANGHWHLQDGGAGVLEAMRGELGRGDQATRAYVTRLARYGIIGESTAAGELREALRDAGVKMTGIEQWTDSRLARTAKAPARAAERIYRINDEIFKIFAFENEVRHWREALPGATIEQIEKIAAERVHNTLPTYSRVPLAVERVRRAALLGSFVSWPAEIVRTGFHTIRYAQMDLRSNNPAVRAMGARRLAGLAIAAGIFPAASALSRYMNNLDDADEKDLRRFMPDWNKNAELLYTGPNREGRASLVDLSYLDPWAYLRKPILAAMRGQDFADSLGSAALESAAPFFGEGVLAKVLLDISRNRDDAGRPVYDEQAGPIDRQLQKLNHAWTAAEPGFVTQGRRIVRAANGEVSPSGRAYQLNDELLALTSGARSQSLDVAQAHHFQSGKFAGDLGLATVTYRRVRDRQGAKPEEIQAAKTQFEQVRAALFRDLYQDTAAAGRLGVSQAQLLANMKAAGLGKAEIVTALTGQLFPYIERPIGKYEQLRRILQNERN